MTEEELLKIYEEIYLYLDHKTIYELRSYGRAFGVKSPSSHRKRDLIMSIIRIGSGTECAPKKSIRGAPPKMQEVAQKDIERLKNMFLCGTDQDFLTEKSNLSASGVETENSAGSHELTSTEKNNSLNFSLSDLKDGEYQFHGTLKIEGKNICIKLESAD